jgi:serine/threonine protein kinase/tetratricopeptide (TPR) repeat protein
MSRDAESIFTAARRRSPDERSAYLDGACGEDAPLRARVDALLAAEAKAGNFLRSAESDSCSAKATQGCAQPGHIIEQAGQSIDRYKLLEQLGEGGFGTVWLAEQREPVKRRVALKIIKLGMDTKQVIARFEAERQALALVDHPNIAKVFDGGATDSGRPYFVMEYIRGVPILEYCDTEKLDTKARLKLFIHVCHALQHAHHKGIIHRDIKPSNVLITLHDGKPVPKVIDFGIAKATNTELTQKTLFTQHRQMVGTPAYMSPEQAEMSGLDIDTRSDVYSLGVLLYELLTGTTPFDDKELLEKGYAEMMRIIREVEPHKPSTRLSSLGDTATRTAEQRRSNSTRLSLILTGDLDWIVMKCLEKDRTRRYETANGLAADIKRHLRDEPVVASPPSTGYRLRKFVKRNRGQVVAASIVAAALVLGVAGTTAGLVWALDEKHRADDEAQRATLAAEAETAATLKAQENEQRAVVEAERAERELARANEVKRLITDMFQSVDPATARTADTTLLKGILDSTAERLSSHEVMDDLIAAELHDVVGGVYRTLGLYAQAEAHLPVALETNKRLLGEEHPATLSSMNDLAILYEMQGRYDEAEQLYVETLETRKRVLGEEHSHTLSSMDNLGLLYKAQHRYDEAESLGLETLEIGRRVRGAEHRDTLGTITNLGSLYTMMGRHDDSARMFETSLPIKRRVLGMDHPWTTFAMSGLATAYGGQGRYTDAESLYLETIEIQRRVLGEEHRDTLGTITNLGYLYNLMGRHDDAAEMYETSLPIKRRVLGMQHPWTGKALSGLIAAYEALDRRDDALPLMRELLNLQTTKATAPDANARALNNAAWTLLSYDIDELQDPERARSLAERACALETADGGENLWKYLDTLALAQHMTGDTATAVETQKRAISLMPSPDAVPGMRDRLAEYEAALAASNEGDGGL